MIPHFGYKGPRSNKLKERKRSMTVKELIKQLKNFDESHNVHIQMFYDSGCASAAREIEEVQFVGGDVRILAEGDW